MHEVAGGQTGEYSCRGPLDRAQRAAAEEGEGDRRERGRMDERSAEARERTLAGNGVNSKQRGHRRAAPSTQIEVVDGDDPGQSEGQLSCHRFDLTATEHKLLRYLLANPRRVLSKAQILDHVWEYDFGGDAGVVETYISYLRRKVDAVAPRLIQTIRGVGYCLRPD